MDTKTWNFYDPDRYSGHSRFVWWDSVVLEWVKTSITPSPVLTVTMHVALRLHSASHHMPRWAEHERTTQLMSRHARVIHFALVRRGPLWLACLWLVYAGLSQRPWHGECLISTMVCARWPRARFWEKKFLNRVFQHPTSACLWLASIVKAGQKRRKYSANKKKCECKHVACFV